MISVKRDTWSLWKAHELEVANQASEARALAPKTRLDGFLDVVPLRCWKHSHDELVSVDGRQWVKYKVQRDSIGVAESNRKNTCLVFYAALQ